MGLSKAKSGKKIRLTLDLSVPFYDRLVRLEKFVNVDTKASLIRQALQLYEYVVKRVAEGYSFRLVDPSGKEETLVFFDFPEPTKLTAQASSLNVA
jgi:hypothetical protein